MYYMSKCGDVCKGMSQRNIVNNLRDKENDREK